MVIKKKARSAKRTKLEEAKPKLNKNRGKTELTLKRKAKALHTCNKNKLDESCIGKKIKVFWPDDGVYYRGKVLNYDSTTKKHEVEYNDGVVEWLKISREKIEWVDDEEDNQDSVC